MSILSQVEFLKGASQSNQFPQDALIEIAFAGRSNVGKSSAINAICGRKKLARTSKTPGRTQQINFFRLGDRSRLVDLPGYGFARVPEAVKQSWEQLVNGYLRKRSNLLVLVLLMDIRRPLEPADRKIMQLATETGIPIQVLLTKADKFKRAKVKSTLLEVEAELSSHAGEIEVEPFSVFDKKQIARVQKQLLEWVEHDAIQSTLESQR